jgi:hypothetical protein
VLSLAYRQPGDIHRYDMLPNASLLGEETCAGLIAQASKARASQMQPELG